MADWLEVVGQGPDLQPSDRENVEAIILQPLVQVLCVLRSQEAFVRKLDQLLIEDAAAGEVLLRRLEVLVRVEVDEAPVLEEAVQTQHAADVAGDLLAALGAGQV